MQEELTLHFGHNRTTIALALHRLVKELLADMHVVLASEACFGVGGAADWPFYGQE